MIIDIKKFKLEFEKDHPNIEKDTKQYFQQYSIWLELKHNKLLVYLIINAILWMITLVTISSSFFNQ